MKKIFLITYYWPPAGGVAVHRWVKFVEYLSVNYNITVFHPEGAAYPMIDNQIIKPEGINEVGVKVTEPRDIFKRIFSKEKKDSSNKKDNLDRLFYIPKSERTFAEKLTLWIRANLFIPDARIWWVSPVVKTISKLIESGQRPDLIITNGPPHSIHLVGLILKKKYKINWLADFRDPWLEIEYFEHMPLTSLARNRHKRMEKEVVKLADAVTVVAPYWKKLFKKRYLGSNVHVITNGYNKKDFDGPIDFVKDTFTIAHVGTLQLDRNAPELWQALKELSEEDNTFSSNFKLQIIGNLDEDVKKEISDFGLSDIVEVLGFQPHAEAIHQMKSANALILLINRSSHNAPGRMTSKIFEYLASQKPIIFLGMSDSDPADVIRETNSGFVISFGDTKNLKKNVKKLYDSFKLGSIKENKTQNIEKYDRKNIANSLRSIIDSIINN